MSKAHIGTLGEIKPTDFAVVGALYTAIRAAASQLGVRAVSCYGSHDELQRIKIVNLSNFANVSLLGRTWEEFVTM